MKSIRVKQVDAFTMVPHTGNPAGVVLDADALSETQMQSIAREINASETAFILRPTISEADIRLRYFTPMSEVPICGHATIASFHVLAEENRMEMKSPGTYEFRLETAYGLLPVEVKKGERQIVTMVGLKIPTFERVPQLKVDLVRVLNLGLSDFEPAIPVLRHENLYVPLRRLHTLFTMKPNFLNIAHYLTGKNLHAICAYTLETIDRDSVVHSRFFAPTIGINEDPVTGSAHGPLGVLLLEHGIVETRNGRCVFQGEQGDAIGRRGRVTVELAGEGGKASSVRIGGTAVTILDGSMVLPE